MLQTGLSASQSFFGRTCKPSKNDGERHGEHGGAALLSKIKLQCKNGGNCNVQAMLSSPKDEGTLKFTSDERLSLSSSLLWFSAEPSLTRALNDTSSSLSDAASYSRYGRRSKYFKVSSVLDAQEKAGISNATPQTSPPLPLAKPVPLPFWSLPVWICQDALIKQQFLSAIDSDVTDNENHVLPQTEPLDLSLKKTSS
ncbi:unnamed protein product [Anisakis simplex]|uniref:Uncharacterized protein n=1 Tax=Anisakis simplex TaxID=6269 RepID=A0A0M3JUK5_ANISI|nr:unnamed protein product [Anisakis simplex]